MSMEYQIPMVSLIFICMLGMIYLFKQKVKVAENIYFNIILVVTILETLINTTLHILCAIFGYDELTGKYFMLLRDINGILGMLFVIVFLSLLAYVLTISYKKIAQNKKIVLLTISIIAVIFKIITSFTSIEIIKIGNTHNVTGSTIDITFATVASLLAITLFFVIKNIKKRDKRYLQVLYMTILMVLIYLAVLFIPGLILYDLGLVLLCYIMYFSIENPDVKLVRELNLAVDAANKANLAKSDFLSSMSHEIRTPLNAVVGLSQDMLDDKNLPEKYRNDTNDIVSASNTLLEIVGNIIDISKIESQKIERIETKYNIKEVVETVKRINQTRIGDKDISLTVKYSADLPGELYGDKQHIKQILTNILSNATKYTEKGYIKVTVKSINKNDKCLLMISVEDTGKGIKKEDLEKLYNKFERLDAEKNSTVEGTGLGLAITKKLVDLLGGTINVQSSFGFGSLFMIQIPQIISSMEEKETTKTELSCDISFLKGKKVLIVDDNLLNIRVAKRMCEKLYAKTEDCLTGKEAIELIKKNKYDLILMDIMMPEMNGIETFNIIKKDKKFNTPVIALTADAISGAETKYTELGFDDYLSKPFSKEQLGSIANKLLNKKK